MSRYRINLALTWVFETGLNSLDAKTQVSPTIDKLLKLLDGHENVKATLNVQQVKDKGRPDRLGVFQLDEVFPHVGPGKKEYQVGDKSYKVKMNSQRYHLFAKDKTCVVCGVVGTVMALEVPPGSLQPHFNLYAIVNGQEILMTKDHIIPKAAGGGDSLDNYQTMCCICNMIKGCSDLTLDEVKALRQIHDKEKAHPTRGDMTIGQFIEAKKREVKLRKAS